MKLFTLSSILFLAGLAIAQVLPPSYESSPYQLQSEIRYMTNEINEAVRSGYLEREEILEIREVLKGALQIARGEGSTDRSQLMCTKGSNGLYYPTNSQTGTIVGSTAAAAGYYQFEECRKSLPAANERVACFKQSNGLFYPTNPRTGTIVGSTAAAAGHYAQADCKSTLPKRREKVACYKQSNGLYYPSNAETGAIIGSTAAAAGHYSLSDCLRIVNQ